MYINIYRDLKAYSKECWKFGRHECDDLSDAIDDLERFDTGNGAMHPYEYLITVEMKGDKIVRKFHIHEDGITDGSYDYNEHRLGSFELCGVQ